jgi:putative FmdB family regulatory protein
MPTYRYRCGRCGEQLEAWQSIRDDSLTVHDGSCGGPLVKVLGVGGIVLKGSGFYRTDSRATPDAKGGRPKEPKGDGAGTDGGAPAKQDGATKPAASNSTSSSSSTSSTSS